MFYNFLKTDFGTFSLIWSRNRLYALELPPLTPTILINNCKNKYKNIEKKSFNRYIQSVAEQLVRYLENPEAVNLELDQDAGTQYTDFQMKVFTAVKKIPSGQNKCNQALGHEIGI